MDSELAEIATVKALTAAGISGSFTADSASFSTRVTANEVVTAKTLLSSSAQIASNISGSFTATSASFSTRVTANDAKLTANTSNVTTAGALMDSELTNLAAVKAINQGLTTTSNVIFNHISASGNITASGNISSSGTITAATLDAAAVSDTLAAAIVAEIDNDEIPIAKLAEDAVTVTAGTGLSGGGSVTLGGSITINSDGLLSSSAQIATDISGAFTAVSASLASDIPTNNNQLTNGAGYTTNTGTVTSVGTGNGLTGTVTTTGNISVDYAGTGNIITDANANASGYSAADDFIIRYNENDEEVQKTSVANFKSGYNLVDTSGTPADNQIAVFTDADTIEGTSKLTFSNSDLLIHSTNADNSGIEIFGGVVGTTATYISPVGSQTIIKFGDGTSGHTFDFQNNKIAFDSDSTNTYIQADSDDPENLEIHADNNIELKADNLVTMTTASIEHRLFDTGSSILAANGGAIGDVVKFGGTSTTAGKIYYLKGDGTWAEARANALGTATSSLAVALGSNSTTNGMCLRGMIHPSTDPSAGIGSPVFLSAGASGVMFATASTTSGDIVRILGHQFGTDLIYFNPSPDFIEIS
jgi:hypothetical protein